MLLGAPHLPGWLGLVGQTRCLRGKILAAKYEAMEMLILLKHGTRT